MSASVFNPLMMSEMRGVGSGREVTRVDLDRVRRNLFNVTEADQALSKQFAEKQLAAQQDQASKRWGFRFQAEKPMAECEGNTSGFQWKGVTARDTIPEAYALRRMEFLGQYAEGASSSSTSAPKATSSKPLKQSLVPDFMKQQKRPRPGTAVKSSSLSSLKDTAEPAAKKSRTRSS